MTTTKLVLLVLLGACGTDGRDIPPDEIVPCDTGIEINPGEPLEQCANACVGYPNLNGPTDCKTRSGGFCRPESSFDLDGLRGCCNDIGKVDDVWTVKYNMCEGE